MGFRNIALTALLLLFGVTFGFANAGTSEKALECSMEFDTSPWKLTFATDFMKVTFYDGRNDIKLKLREANYSGKNNDVLDLVYEGSDRGTTIRFLYQYNQKNGWLVDYVGTSIEQRHPFRCKKT